MCPDGDTRIAKPGTRVSNTSKRVRCGWLFLLSGWGAGDEQRSCQHAHHDSGSDLAAIGGDVTSTDQRCPEGRTMSKRRVQWSQDRRAPHDRTPTGYANSPNPAESHREATASSRRSRAERSLQNIPCAAARHPAAATVSRDERRRCRLAIQASAAVLATATASAGPAVLPNVGYSVR
jgi:hypothetical protein